MRPNNYGISGIMLIDHRARSSDGLSAAAADTGRRRIPNRESTICHPVCTGGVYNRIDNHLGRQIDSITSSFINLFVQRM